MSVTIIRTIELIDEEEKEVEFNCDYIIANTGIGSYEWWGSREFDAGYDHAIVEKVKWDESLFSPEENEIINKWVIDNRISIEEEVYDKHIKYASDIS
jgi:hypothetical protein